MLDLLFIVSIIDSIAQVFRENNKPVVPIENWANKDLYYEDMMSGSSTKQLMKNVENGKYRAKEVYPEPHRGADGRIIIENCKLYNEDLLNYGAVQAQKWVKQGKYNLTPEELKMEIKRIEDKYKKI